jgi:hypothetical protein
MVMVVVSWWWQVFVDAVWFATGPSNVEKIFEPPYFEWYQANKVIRSCNFVPFMCICLIFPASFAQTGKLLLLQYICGRCLCSFLTNSQIFHGLAFWWGLGFIHRCSVHNWYSYAHMGALSVVHRLNSLRLVFTVLKSSEYYNVQSPLYWAIQEVDLKVRISYCLQIYGKTGFSWIVSRF